MLRPAVLGLVAGLMGCAAPGTPNPTRAMDTSSAEPSHYVDAPVVGPIDYRMPPDSRDRLCGDTRQDSSGSFATVTKSATRSFCGS
jgi:hypothetical protein